MGTETYDPRDDNLTRSLDAIREVAADGAELIVFGEMYLSGYRTDEWLYKWATTVDPPDAEVQRLLGAAHKHRVHVIMGVATFGNAMPGDIYNSALFVGPEGVLGVYRKTHVAAFPHSEGISKERCFYSPGKELPVFDTDIGRVGVHICFDLGYPEVVRVQALKGAELVVNTSALAHGFEEYVDHCTYVRAAENATWLAICSAVGEQRGDVLFGGSRVIDPTGRTVALGKLHDQVARRGRRGGRNRPRLGPARSVPKTHIQRLRAGPLRGDRGADSMTRRFVR